MVAEEKLIIKYLRIGLVVILYWIVSISMVFLNKKLLGGAEMGTMDAPLFITAFQCFVTAIACILMGQLATFLPKVASFPEMNRFEREKAKKIFPLTVMFVGMISMNNLSLKYVGIAFYYVGRSLTTVFNVIFTYLFLGEKTSLSALFCCGTIIGGFWLGIDQEETAGSLSVIGVLFGVSASALVSLNAILTKKVLPVVDGSIWLLTFYNNILAIAIFLPLIVITGELPAVYQIFVRGNLSFWGLLILSGIIGFSIGFVTGLQIKVTSPLTHNVSGTAKACAQTVMATWWFNESKEWLWWVSNWMVLGGSMAYTKVKQIQMKQAHDSVRDIGKFRI